MFYLHLESHSITIFHILTAVHLTGDLPLIHEIVHPQELVISIHQGKEYNGLEALAVVEEAASPLWTSDWNMPSIQGTQGMQKVLPPVEDGLPQQPILRECVALHHLISMGPGDSFTDLRYKLLDGLTGHPESILQSGVAVTSGEMCEGYCQLDSWTHRISHQDHVPLELSSDSLL